MPVSWGCCEADPRLPAAGCRPPTGPSACLLSPAAGEGTLLGPRCDPGSCRPRALWWRPGSLTRHCTAPGPQARPEPPRHGSALPVPWARLAANQGSDFGFLSPGVSGPWRRAGCPLCAPSGTDPLVSVTRPEWGSASPLRVQRERDRECVWGGAVGEGLTTGNNRGALCAGPGSAPEPVSRGSGPGSPGVGGPDSAAGDPEC